MPRGPDGRALSGADAAAKHGVEGFSESLRRELQLLGIDVVIVAPGAVATAIWDTAEALPLDHVADTIWDKPYRTFIDWMVENGREGAYPRAGRRSDGHRADHDEAQNALRGGQGQVRERDAAIAVAETSSTPDRWTARAVAGEGVKVAAVKRGVPSDRFNASPRRVGQGPVPLRTAISGRKVADPATAPCARSPDSCLRGASALGSRPVPPGVADSVAPRDEAALIETPPDAAEKLVRLLDYIEEVVKLDERTAFRVADYRLTDGSTLAVADTDMLGLPGVRLDERDDEGAVWLAVERLARRDPPATPDAIAPWLAVSGDPNVLPEVKPERIETAAADERAALVAAGAARDDDVTAGPGASADSDAAQRFDRRIRLADDPAAGPAIEAWVAGPWAEWATQERPRRRTIALYGRLYRLQQMLESGGAERAVEAVWGIGTVRWRKDGRTIDRPLFERELELELGTDGTLRVRPTEADARFDLKPYEEFGCANLHLLETVIRAELARTGVDEGVTPFRPDTFEPGLVAAATRFAPNGRYLPDGDPPTASSGAAPGHAAPGDEPVVGAGSVLFARPRSRHVVLDDVARFRTLARSGVALEGLAARLVAPPAERAEADWRPLGAVLDGAGGGDGHGPALDDVFFPKPFNDEQVAIVRRLAGGEGLVVQGPPGTGKTHTIANLICHAMALGQRVLVVSRGEAALAVLRDQIPEKVRPLAIAILSSERQGLRQVEGAIREIQAIVEESRPEIRRSAIRRCEAEIAKTRARIAAIDREAEAFAALQFAPLGPRREAPAELARRVAAERADHGWFTDRPARPAADTGLSDADIDAVRDARRAAAPVFDHVDAVLPAVIALPGPDEVAGWHEDMRRAGAVDAAVALHLDPALAAEASLCARNLRDLAVAWDALGASPWLVPIVRAAARGEDASWAGVLEELCRAWRDHEAERVRLAPFAVAYHGALLDDEAAIAAVGRGAQGERMWPLVSFKLSGAKDLVAAIRVRGGAPGNDADAWRAVAAAIAAGRSAREIAARWGAFGAQAGRGGDDDGAGLPAAGRVLNAVARVRATLEGLGGAARGLPSASLLVEDPGALRAAADRLDEAAARGRAAAVRDAVERVLAHFPGADRTSAAAGQILRELLGREEVGADRVAAVWSALLGRIGALTGHAAAFATVRAATERIADAGAPCWARRLRTEPPSAEGDALLPADWRRAWDAGVAEAALGAIDARERLGALARERDAADRRSRKLFVELVRERAYDALDRRLSPRVKSALVEYVRAIARLGRGTGRSAGRHRRTARDAMARCYDAVPCWIMPTWRVAEQLPADLASFDLVILDEASQSDVTELPALLRGRKILAVGDDRQVSPTPPFVTRGKIDQLRHHFLRGLPYAALFEPGESLYDLMRAVFPDGRLMLKEHFRCVEPIIRFSMGFYPEKLVPLRVPSAAEKLDPPLVDIFVPHGARDGARKINRAEAEVIVDEIAALGDDPATRDRSVGVISLIGAEQAELVRVMLAERIGEEAMQRHALLCGDSATFQGNERDIVFLSMVADRGRRTTLTALPYEQRFNVAASRARDRLVLVRSVELADLASRDLKYRLITHFAEPLAGRAPGAEATGLDACESDFERDVMRRLTALGYRVEPQVGAQGFRIDLVVEGPGGRRLAVECDGDGFHGPERWRDDTVRQRILERVGWRFWRCFASNFYRDPDGVTADLVAALGEAGVAPWDGTGQAVSGGHAVVAHRRIEAPKPLAGLPGDEETTEAAQRNGSGREGAKGNDAGAGPGSRVGVGDRVALLFPDRSRLTLKLTADADDHARGLLSLQTPLGRAVANSEEGEEVDVPAPDGPPTRVLVEAVERAA